VDGPPGADVASDAPRAATPVCKVRAWLSTGR